MNALKLAADLQKIIDPEDELQGWSIVRNGHEVKFVKTYRTGCTLSHVILTSDPEFINASV